MLIHYTRVREVGDTVVATVTEQAPLGLRAEPNVWTFVVASNGDSLMIHSNGKQTTMVPLPSPVCSDLDREAHAIAMQAMVDAS